MLAEPMICTHERMVLDYIWEVRPQGSLAPLTQVIAEGLEHKMLVMRSGELWALTKQGIAILAEDLTHNNRAA